jgi:hypothetical protein
LILLNVASSFLPAIFVSSSEANQMKTFCLRSLPMQPLRGIAATAKTAISQRAGNLQTTYAQAGLTGVLIGAVLGIVIDRLRSRGVSMANGLRQF